ncbi:MAG: ferritin family protein [Planctomycetota bacterium]|nr:MAG: ferritin family protein [Planctomycetota bacterium]
MGESDSTDEILEFAIAREMEANELYMELAVRLENPAMRELSLEFAKEELEHKAKLELEVFKRGKVLHPVEKTAGFKTADYMVDFAVKPDMNYKDLLIMAIEKEKKSLRLYIDLAAIIDDKNSRETLISIAEEEARHKVLFEIEYDEARLREK